MNDFTTNRTEVDRRDDLRKTAMLNADGETLSTLLHDNLIFVHAAGQWEEKARHVDAVGSGRVKYLAWDQTDIRSTPLGPNGWLKNGRAKLVVQFGGNNVDLDLVFSAVWCFDGEWKLISWQSTPWPK